ncbi:MAG: tubulin-like doman-containing protein [Clostridiaceae bacterium]
MKPIIRDHIKQLDVSLGGGIISEKIRVDTIENRMLVIGIGGTGIDALLRLKYQINRGFKLPEDPITKKKKEKPDNIEYLAFETNEGDAQKKYKEMKLEPDSELVLLANSEIGSILQNRSRIEDYISEWLSPELQISDGMKGACGNRQAGRLLMFTKINLVVESIRKKINILSEGTNKKLFVFILTGISGGTGSGCFLDIAYIIRGIMENKYGAAGVDKADILGYIFTPDVNLSNRSLSIYTQEYIQKNGYAALKELDYWMNIESTEERFCQRYGNVLEVNSQLPPFNLCHLISATNMDAKFLENAYDYCMNVTAENITNFMANEEKQAGEEFAIQDYISNISTNIAQMPKPYPANYKYNIIGASAAILPIEEITTYLAYRLFKKIEKMFGSAPDKQDVENYARKLGIDRESVLRKFEERIPEPIPGYENSERFNYNNVIKTQAVSLDTELEQGFLSKAREEYIKMRRQLPGQLLERFREVIHNVFLDPGCGPIYISRLLNSTKGFCLLKTIESYIEAVENDKDQLPRYIKEQEDNSEALMKEARNAIISKEKKKNAYIEVKINEYTAKADEIKMGHMIEFYQELYNLMNEENNRIYSIFTEVLDTLNQIFNKNANILINAAEATDYKGNRTYYWNVVTVPDVIKMVDSIMDEKDSGNLLHDFLDELLKDTDKWTKEKEVDVVGSISEFLTDKFGDLITKTMEDFLSFKYGQDERLDQIVKKKIAGKLDAAAVPVFHLSNSTGSLNFPSFGLVSVPIKTPAILKGIKEYQTEAIGKSGTRFNIKESAMTNRIFWLNTMNGVPLYAYAPMSVLETCYEKTITEREGIGRHLVNNGRNDWINLPSPIPEKAWGDTYCNARVKEHNTRVRALFDRARYFKVIVEKDISINTSSRFECRITRPFDLNGFLAGYTLKAKDGNPNFPGIIKCLKDMKTLMENGFEIVTLRNIFDSYNEEFAKENFIRTPKLIFQVEDEVKKYEGLAAKIKEYEDMIKIVDEENRVLENFIEALYTDTITKKGALYVYDKDLTEDPMEAFVDLTSTRLYPEYSLFKAFTALHEKQKQIIIRKTDKRKKLLLASDDTKALVDKLSELESIFTKRKETLDIEQDELVDGFNIYNFYKKVLLSLKAIKENL